MMKKVISVAVCIFLLVFTGCDAVYTSAITALPPSPSVQAPAPSPVATPSPTATPLPTPKPAPTRITVMAAGDLLCLYAQLCAAHKDGAYQFDYCFDKIKAKVSSADLAIANFETLVVPGQALTKSLPDPPPEDPSGSGSDEPYKHGNTRMNAPETYLSAVVNCGFDVLTNANNHAGDQKPEGIVSTLQMLDKYGMKHTGAYAAQGDKKPLIVDVKGIHIAILAYTDLLNHNLGKNNAFMVDRYKEELVTTDIAAAKAAGADFTIVCVHWGKENTHRPNSRQEKVAAFIANAGADIILGSHSHCSQPFASIETPHGKVPVIYSLGNFVSSMGSNINRDSLLLSLVLEKDNEKNTTSLVELKYMPTYCANTQEGNFVVLPADMQSIAASGSAGPLEASRKRTIEVLSNTVAIPE